MRVGGLIATDCGGVALLLGQRTAMSVPMWRANRRSISSRKINSCTIAFRVPLVKALVNVVKTRPMRCHLVPTFDHQRVHTRGTILRTRQYLMSVYQAHHFLIRMSIVWLQAVAKYLPQGHPEGPDVTFIGKLSILYGFGGHPSHRNCGHPGQRVIVQRINSSRDAELGDFHNASFSDEHVSGSDVPVHGAASGQVFHSAGDLSGNSYHVDVAQYAFMPV